MVFVDLDYYYFYAYNLNNFGETDFIYWEKFENVSIALNSNLHQNHACTNAYEKRNIIYMYRHDRT